MTNTLAYYIVLLTTTVKSFIVQATEDYANEPGAVFTTFFVTYEWAQ
jgi:hypothetical protein